MVRLAGNPVNITIIAIYAPINPNGRKEAITDSDNFYIDLQETINKASRGDLVLIMGDFNARVGLHQHQTTLNVVSPHAVDQMNENGQKLVDLCSVNRFIIANTFFQCRRIHQVT